MEGKFIDEQKEPLKKDGSPFFAIEKSRDIPEGSAVFYDVAGHPELVARKCYILSEVESLINREIKALDEYKDSTSEELLAVYEKKKAQILVKVASEFKKIYDSYHLRVAETHYVIGRDPGKKDVCVFAVTDRIKGESLDKHPLIPSVMEEEFDNIYSGIFSHLINSYEKNEPYWKDFTNRQIMYGTKFNEDEPHLYIIDVDPVVTTWEQNPLSKKFWQYIYRVWGDMMWAIKKTKSVNFTKSKKELKNIMSKIPPPEDDYLKKKYYFAIRRYVDNDLS